MQQQQQPTNGFHQDPGYSPQQQQPQVFQPNATQGWSGGGGAVGQPPAANFMHPTFHPQSVAATNQPAVRKTPEPPKPKAPLPEEFIYLQTVLEELRTQCIQTATNPVRSKFLF